MALEGILSKVRGRVAEKKEDAAYTAALKQRLDETRSRKPLPFPKPASGNLIIAEVKRSSPSKGAISGDPVDAIVSDYVRGGAAALSVLTEPDYFGGSLEILERVRAISDLPILRKDFILDEIQVKEARAYGADGVLLMASVLNDAVGELLDAARAHGLWALVEAHTGEEVEAAVSAGAKFLGVNNRDMRTLEVDLDTAVRLSEHIPADRVFVVESGINKGDDIKYLKENCVRTPDAYLIGSALMEAEDRKGLLEEFVNA